MSDFHDLPAWQRDAENLDDYNICEARTGRKFLLRLNTGADPTLAIEKFAREHDVKYAVINTAYMGAFQPTHYYAWAPNNKDPENWHYEAEAHDEHLSMLTAIGGMISQRPTKEGGTETFAVMHFVAGGAWDHPTFSGHLLKGTRVKGVMACLITELLDIEVMQPVDIFDGVYAYSYPEAFYKNVAKKDEE